MVSNLLEEHFMTPEKTPEEYFKIMNEIVVSDKFLNREGYSEVPFFICPFDPKISIDMEKNMFHLLDNLISKGIKALNINLYDLAINKLKEREVLNQIIENETDFEKQELKESLQSMLNTQEVLIDEIQQLLDKDKYKLVFLSGVGEVFPYIRSHNILNNLQTIIKNIPMVMFFPGEYKYIESEGSSLRLFNIMLDDRYYRAFNILEYRL